MKSHIHFSIDRDLICAIMVGVLSGIVTLAMFFLSGYMITQSALGAPLYALMILVVWFFKSNYTLYRKITFTQDDIYNVT